MTPACRDGLQNSLGGQNGLLVFRNMCATLPGGKILMDDTSAVAKVRGVMWLCAHERAG